MFRSLTETETSKTDTIKIVPCPGVTDDLKIGFLLRFQKSFISDRPAKEQIRQSTTWKRGVKRPASMVVGLETACHGEAESIRRPPKSTDRYISQQSNQQGRKCQKDKLQETVTVEQRGSWFKEHVRTMEIQLILAR